MDRADRPPEPQPAATIVVARPGRDGVEVLVLRRAPGSRFARPTFRTLQRLAACSSVEDVLALRVEQEPPPKPGSGRSPEWLAFRAGAVGLDAGSATEASA